MGRAVTCIIRAIVSYTVMRAKQVDCFHGHHFRYLSIAGLECLFVYMDEICKHISFREPIQLMCLSDCALFAYHTIVLLIHCLISNVHYSDLTTALLQR